MVDPNEESDEGSEYTDDYTRSEEDEMVECSDDNEDDGLKCERYSHNGVRNWKVRDIPRPLADTSVPGYQTIACFMAGRGDKCPVCHQQRNTIRNSVLPERVGLCGPSDVKATGVGLTTGKHNTEIGLVPARPKIIEIDPPRKGTNASSHVVKRRRRKTKADVPPITNYTGAVQKTDRPEGSKSSPMVVQE